jgi:hypothetical protein
MFAISMVAQTAAPAAPKTDDKTCACCADKAKCEACCKEGCKDCAGMMKDGKMSMKDGKMADCCKGKDGKMACARDKDGKMACCKDMKDMKDMKDGKMSKGCCGGMCDRKAHEKKAGM